MLAGWDSPFIFSWDRRRCVGKGLFRLKVNMQSLLLLFYKAACPQEESRFSGLICQSCSSTILVGLKRDLPWHLCFMACRHHCLWCIIWFSLIQPYRELPPRSWKIRRYCKISSRSWWSVLFSLFAPQLNKKKNRSITWAPLGVDEERKAPPEGGELVSI